MGALLSCGLVAGCAWGLASTLGAMHETARIVSDARTGLATPFSRKAALAAEVRPERRVKIAKFSRLGKPSESELRRQQLTVAAIRMAHQRSVAVQLAFNEQKKNEEKKKVEQARIEAAIALAKRSVEQEQKISGTPTLVTALAEDVSTRDLPPFGLVLAKPETDEEAALPSQIPLPEARPLIEKVVTEEKPSDRKTVARQKPGVKDAKQDLAYAKPERSLLGDLFKRRTDDAGWSRKNSKVAIYDVSNATVTLPDGTKLRAHSGIGAMRDNPRYEHVTMRGPTPAGIYRLKMREERFYGVEAIRMTSIDGRDPKNRTGLLTHTNLLRGQIGSHGCVAFQNYQPFLRAFKRGQINTLVVVPRMPSSSTQLAALYRKAGA